VLYSNAFDPRAGALGMDCRVDTPGHVRVHVYNLAGQKVATLLNEYRPGGAFRLNWSGRNDKGEIVGNSVYMVLIETPDGRTIRKVIVLK
jgi:flagellar hook assembly protein FlgD